MTSPKTHLRDLVRRLPHPVRVRLKGAIAQGERAAGRAARTPAGRRVLAATNRDVPHARPGSTAPDGTRQLALDAATHWFAYAVEPSSRYLLQVQTTRPFGDGERAILVRYRFLTLRGEVIESDQITKARSEVYGPFDYLPRTPNGDTSDLVVFTPDDAASVHIGFRRWKPADDAVTELARVSFTAIGPRTVIRPYDLPDHLEPRRPVRLAVIADTFTIDALGNECDVLALSRQHWRDEIVSFAPDMVVIESAWNGNDGQWQYCLHRIAPDDRRVRDLVEFARERDIPTLFWNKEDPPHFDDFIDAASLCDHVATTDASLLDAYRARLGHDRVFALPFCVQIDLHNPRRPFDEKSARASVPVFLGSWWAEKFDERRDAQDALLEGSRSHGVEIYDRYLLFNDHERYRFPARWLPFIHDTLAYRRALTAYRHYAIVLNVNTVTTSPTMFSRRALEASACGAFVISNPSAGTEAAFGELVAHAGTAAEVDATLKRLSEVPDRIDRAGHLAYRHVHRHHTWAERMQDIAAHTGLQVYPRSVETISVVLATKRPEGANRIVRWLASLDQHDYRLEPILICAFEPSQIEASAELDRLGATVVEERDGDTLGDSLNRGADLATGEFVAKLDDDDLYGTNYFGDLLLAKRYSRAEIVGKQCHFQYFEAVDRTVIRYPLAEHRAAQFVCGSTLLMDRAVFERVRFPSRRVGEDSVFLARARDRNISIHSADRWNYISMRRSDLDSHTWQADSDELLRGAETCDAYPGLATHVLDV